MSTYNITVNPLADAGTIGGPTSVCAGSNIILTENKTGGVWSSGTPGIATVNSSGTVTGVAAGNVTIYYAVTNSCGTVNASYNITVGGAPTVAGISGGAASVCSGAQTPAFTDATAGGTWSITNISGTATITTGGIVTGGSAGSVTVNYSVPTVAAQLLLMYLLP